MNEPNAKVPGYRLMKEDDELTRPIRITTETRLPGMKHVEKRTGEYESAIIISEYVSGAVRSKNDPTEFHEKKEGLMESYGFRKPEETFHLLATALISFVKRLSGQDRRAYRQNVLSVLTLILHASGISEDDVSITISNDCMEELKQLKEEQKKKRP